jgi:hypothetical protein
MWWTLGIGSAVLLFVLGNWLGARVNWRGSTKRISELANVIRWAVKRGNNNAMLRIESIENRSETIDFCKRIKFKLGASFALKAVISDPALCRLVFDDATSLTSPENVMMDGPSKIVVECGKDIDLGIKLCHAITSRGWTLETDEMVRVRHRGGFIVQLLPSADPKWIE